MNNSEDGKNRPVLQVSSLGKCYRSYGSELTRIAGWFGWPAKVRDEQWVLRDINFSLMSGETIGIVGQNGAGKSTLLKIIAGTLRASIGHVDINGRISAILELGMGFHPDLTGRQNVYHAAGLLGHSRAQIDRVIEDVKAFTEIEHYFDQPVRTYSSGMQMRVAFAVATMFRPEVLIIDEALSVGDVYFQHKSFELIRQFQQQGTTLLLVSHDRSAIQSICNRALLLEKGYLIQDGLPEEVMDFYNALIAEKENRTLTQQPLVNGRVQTRSGSGEARLESLSLLNVRQEPVEMVAVGEKITLQATVRVYQDIPALVLGYMIKDRLGQPIFGTNTYHLDAQLKALKAGEEICYRFHFPANLGVGSYSIAVALHTQDTHLAANYEWRDLALLFSIVNLNQRPFTGVSWLLPEFECQR